MTNLFILDTEKLKTILQSTIDVLSQTKRFHTEVAQLSRFIFMNVKQFRTFRGLKEMQKTHQALLRYLNLNIVSSLENLKSFIHVEREFVILPHRPSLDFILIRLQGLSKILIRAVITTRKASRYFLGLIKCGYFYVKGILFSSTMASIWNHCRNICVKIVESYNELVKFRLKFDDKPGIQWVDVKYELPERLDEWLGEEYEEFIVNEVYELKLMTSDVDPDRTLESCAVDKFLEFQFNEPTELNDEMDVSYTYQKPQEEVEILQSLEMEIDDFTPIPRMVKEKEEKSSNPTNSDKAKITEFLKNESFNRKHNNEKSLTVGKMQKKEWKMFASDVRNKILLMPENLLLEYVKDCLEDYNIVSF